MTQDEDHLRMLAIGHYVVGGLLAFVACIPLIHLTIGLMIVFRPEMFGDPAKQPAIIGWLFAGIAAVLILAGWFLAILIICAGRCLHRHRYYTFCFIMACLACMFMPIGTALGVLTLIVLVRPTVKQLFEKPAALG